MNSPALLTADILENIQYCPDLKSLSIGSNDWEDAAGPEVVAAPETIAKIFCNLSQVVKVMFARMAVTVEVYFIPFNESNLISFIPDGPSFGKACPYYQGAESPLV